MIKNICKTPPVNSTFQDREVNAFPIRLRRRKIFSHHCYSVVLEAPADIVRHIEEIKGIYTIKKETCVYNSDDMMDEVENSKGFAKRNTPKPF